MDRLFHAIDHRTLRTAFDRVGLGRGMTVCVHSSLSRLGFVHGGADTIIDALIEVVGGSGCILMPTFTGSGSMQSTLDAALPFDVRSTPSAVGALTESFRRRPGVHRSLHPTNSVAALGGDAEIILRDHHLSRTPFGAETPYGRLADRDDAYVLMIETHIHSLLHHLQERVDLPHLFLPGEREVEVIDQSGEPRMMRTRVTRPRTPYFIPVPSSGDDDPDFAILHDFALIFPRQREREVRRLGYRFEGYPRLWRRRAELEAEGILRSTRLGRGEIGLLHVRSFVEKVEPELRDLLARYGGHLDPDAVAMRALPYS